MTQDKIKTNAAIYTTEYYFETPEQFYGAGAKSRDEEIGLLKEIVKELLSWEDRADYDYKEYEGIKSRAEQLLKE